MALILSRNSFSGAKPLSLPEEEITNAVSSPKRSIPFANFRAQRKRNTSHSSHLSSHGPKSSNGTVIINLKSKHDPQTNRLTVISLEAFLISGKNSSTALAMASKLGEVPLSPSYLHLHSRQTRLKDMAPLAKGTDSADRAEDRSMEGAGAKADAVAAKTAKRAAEVFMVMVNSRI